MNYLEKKVFRITAILGIVCLPLAAIFGSFFLGGVSIISILISAALQSRIIQLIINDGKDGTRS